MTITDILGLAKIFPIKEGLSAIMKPYRDRWDLKTEILRLNTFIEMAQSAKDAGLDIKYNGTSGLSISSETNEKGPIKIPEVESFINITLQKVVEQEIEKKINSAKILSVALDNINEEDQQSAENIDKDWGTRFSRIAEDVSNDEMQALWGQLLAGEIKEPKSYSLRTMDILRNMIPYDANIFKSIAPFAIRNKTKNLSFIARTPLSNKYINFSDILHLREIGLIQDSDNLALSLTFNDQFDIKYYNNGSTTIELQGKIEPAKADISVYIFTKAGNELLKLVEKSSAPQYVDEFINGLEPFQISGKSYTKISIDSLGNLYVPGMPNNADGSTPE